MGIIFGLLAAVGWGTSDFFMSRVNRQIGLRQGLFWIQTLGTLAIVLVLLLSGDVPPSDPLLWLWALLVNAFNVIATILLYHALSVGTVAIVSPIAASFAVVTTALAILGGERPSALALMGVTLVIGGVIIVSRAGADNRNASLRGMKSAIGSAIFYGLFFWLLAPITAEFGIIWPVFIGRVLAMFSAILMLAWARESIARPANNTWRMLVVAVIVDTLGFLSYNLGISSAYVSVVTALASIFSAVTVLLAWLFLRERLVSLQWAGVAALICGVLLVSV
ncbi:DMT family transporter [Candidatus Viridilinea mediisalina]|uniref:EamA family transporter n=1 Tax=Candidatus Viridilinea mediisalina TaxID=2024553 RepID=A0A2A6RJI8_9CHLR|nr:DMT family transporter [Candidatus Viridilinea mediisalina]PDW03101.1 EamA family transporter [Candidatus Viridilinea mediisalina]